MMDFSIAMLPVVLAGASLSNRVLGPKKTVVACSRLSGATMALLGSRCSELDLVACESAVRWIHRFARICLGAQCLEKACALTQWFACHGVKADIVIGHCVQDGQLLMHAWVEVDHEKKFFYDSKFNANWRSDSVDVVSTVCS